ncbi:MAG: secondary thiamine-phosphate synthase enzyme YjbQ [Dehalococcoidales bacterium]|nr:secondary thiamine-phosphate synthase enzyme YjbQ [Dehalococcoidales bacterium]
MIQKLDIKTREQAEFQEITLKVREIVRDSGVENGVCVVYIPHTTAGIMINEHADPDVVNDILNRLEEMAPRRGEYRHSEGNAAAHIKAALIGSSVTLPITYGELALGTWQGIFFGEFDGPRNRQVLVRISADK